MNEILKSRRNRIIIAVGVLVFVILLIMNLVQLGDATLVATTLSLANITVLIFAAVQSLLYWKTISNRQDANRVWLLLAIGLTFHGLGELTWLVYTLLGTEMPYPSWGDLFWVVSYIPLLVALVNRNHLLGVRPTGRQTAWVIAFGVALFAIVLFFILIPIAREAGQSRLLEVALNFLYPILDFLIMIAAAFLVVNLWKGQLSITWNIIAIGMLVMTVSDILFVYVTWNGMYYAEGDINFISRMTDLGYALAYMLVALGVYVQRDAFSIKTEPVDFTFTHVLPVERPAPQLLPYTSEVQNLFEYLTFMVDQDNQVFFFSESFRGLCSLAGSPSPSWGKPLHRVIGIEEAVVDDLFAKTLKDGRSARPAEIILGNYRIPVVIQVVSFENSKDVYLKYRQENLPVALEEKTPVETLLINEILKSVRGSDNITYEMKEVTAFFIIEVQELYTYLVRMNGFRVGQILVEKFNRAAANKNAEVCIADGRVMISSALPIDAMAQLLQLTLLTVRDLTTVEATQGVVRQLNEKMPENIVRAAQRAGLAL
jgi:hypothetical protein